MASLGNLLVFLFFFMGKSHACSCGSLNLATCDESSCQCYINVGEGQSHIFNCSSTIPKCFLMKAEMYSLRRLSFSQNKPTETALADGNDLYDPECGPSGLFKAKQCNKSDVCWCVDSAGVRISGKSDKSLKCDEPVETNWGHDQFIQTIISKPLGSSQLERVFASAIQDQKPVSKIKVKYDVEASLITLDLNDIGDHTQDLSGLGYYMETDVDQMSFEGTGKKLELDNFVVYYEEEVEEEVEEEEEDEEPTTLTFGIFMVIVVAILAATIGLLFLFLIRRQKRSKYEKAQTNEMEDI